MKKEEKIRSFGKHKHIFNIIGLGPVCKPSLISEGIGQNHRQKKSGKLLELIYGKLKNKFVFFFQRLEPNAHYDQMFIQ